MKVSKEEIVDTYLRGVLDGLNGKKSCAVCANLCEETYRCVVSYDLYYPLEEHYCGMFEQMELVE